MELLKRTIEILFSPAGVLSILTVPGLILIYAKQHHRLGRRLLISSGVLSFLIFLTPLVELLTLGLEWNYPPILNPPQSPEIRSIVVLAGYAEENTLFPMTTVLSESTISRCVEGLRQYRAMPESKVILSGGIVCKGDRPVAASMADFLQQLGVPSSDILIEGTSHNTYENLVEVKKIVGQKPFLLITHACDMRRAMAIARKQQMNPIPAPACHWALQYYFQQSNSRRIFRVLHGFLNPSAERLKRLQWVYHEYAGYLWYRLLGRI
jgi:uncharacterized SAM-binding protein YcdF (DUF218 family)